MWPNPQFPADLVTFTGEILNWEIYLLCSVAVKSDETSHRSSFHVLLYLDSSICRKYFMQDCRRQTMINIRKWYYVKSVRIRSYSGPYFPASGLNTERYGVSLRIQSECRKIRTRENSVFGHFSRSVFLTKYYNKRQNAVNIHFGGCFKSAFLLLKSSTCLSRFHVTWGSGSTKLWFNITASIPS